MGICANCDKPIEGNRQTCSDRCRQALRRSKPTVTNVTLQDCDKPTVTKGKCWCCGDEIDGSIIVCCQECAWSGRAARERAGSYPPLLTDRTPAQMETALQTVSAPFTYLEGRI